MRKDDKSIVKDIKSSLAVKYYKEEKLSLGQCSKLAEMPKEGFIKLLSTYKISIFNFENDKELIENMKHE